MELEYNIEVYLYLESHRIIIFNIVIVTQELIISLMGDERAENLRTRL